jgi:GLPGLI family protein
MKFAVLITFLFFTTESFSQFISKGKIEFERKTNQHAFMDENSIFDEAMKKNLPKFVTYYFDLSFDNGRSLYKPGRETDVRQNKYWGVFDGDNIISVNLDSNRIITQKTIFGDAYLITDSPRKVNWKISSEMRTIAGFECRKAIGRVLDSIIVIAFYTDQITSGSGPESFSGLPGMILGLAIPRMHTTWYATRLQLTEVSEKDLATPKKGKKYAADQFKTDLTNIMKNWGEEYQKLKWQLLL